MGYTPAFSDIYMGTLYGKWPAAAVWASLLPLMDRNGCIDMSLQAISGMTGWPMDLLEEGIRQLMEPDPHSRTPDCEGRRLVLIDPNRPWGWKAVNHGKYREKARKQNYDAERVASGENRARMAARRKTTSPEPDLPAPTRADPRRPGATRDDPTRPDATRADPLSNTDSDTDKDISPDRESLATQGSSTRAPKNGAARASPTPIPDDWEPNELNRRWLAEAGLTIEQRKEVVREFVAWAKHSGRRQANWDLAFSRNPHVKSAVGRARANRLKAGELDVEKDRRQIIELAKVLGIEQSADDWPTFRARVLAANDRRLQKLHAARGRP